ncbi:MAG: hypothetical protein DRJ37_00900 [Thermoprotei archaeon]|nr:MAG: hypothetical protein DRJ37_00900 [Thermoprotei archaeon]
MDIEKSVEELPIEDCYISIITVLFIRGKTDFLKAKSLLEELVAIVYDLYLYTGNIKHFERLKCFGLKFYKRVYE